MEMLSNSVFDADKTKQTRIKYGQSAASFFLVLIGLIMLLLFSLAFSVCIGIAGGNIRILADAIMHPVSASDIGKIMIDMRIPRALAACLTGAAFALAGAVMQGLTRNPLADAGLLGINAGAGLFVALSVALLPSASSIITILSAFVGASFAVILVYGFGAGKRKTESFRLILAGAAISALLTAMSQAVSIAFGIAKVLSFWSAGSLSGITWQSLGLIVPFIIVAGIIGFALSGRLSALALGEGSAIGLGINVQLVRLIGILVVLLLAGQAFRL
ncbi:MAG: FecCD family ABC transporter permease [Candidatus Alectryocaccobium sp.]|jgi:iron complex transport system permease protein